MTVEIINLTAMRPAQSAKGSHNGHAGGAAVDAVSGGAGFDAALALRRAAVSAGDGTVPSALPQGVHKGVQTGHEQMRSAEDDLLSAPGPQIQFIDITGAGATHPPATADAQARLPEALSSEHSHLALAAVPGARQPGAALHPADTATRPARPVGDAMVDARIDTRTGTAQAAPAHDPALPGAAAQPAGALGQAVLRPVAGAAKAPVAASGREGLVVRAGAAPTAGNAAAANNAHVTKTALDVAAPRTAAEPETFMLARNAAQPAAALPDGRAPAGAGETLNFLTPPAAQPAPVPASAPATANPPAFTGQLNAPLGSDGWNQALNQQSLRLSHFGDGRAELTLHPRELGQIQVSLKMGEQTQLHFASSNAQVRAAVEAALPQLRHAFADSGINLGQTSVSDQSSQQFNSEQQPRSRGDGFPGPADEALPAPVAVTTLAGRTLDGGIDIFA